MLGSVRGLIPPSLVMKSCRNLFGWPWGSKEKIKERKEKFTTELGKGYILELQEYRQNKGKRFRSEGVLLPENQAVKFPSVSGSALSGSSLSLPLPQTSVVLVSLKAMGMHMCEQYRKPLEEELGGSVPVVEVSLLETSGLRLLQQWIKKNLRKSIPPSRHNAFVVYFGKVASELRRVLDIQNSIVGHAYLVDKEGLIRWRAHAVPTHKELQMMTKNAQELLNSDT